MSAHYLQLEGKRFGRLVVLKQLPSKNYKSMWLCKCDCGNEHITAGAYLVNGDTKSCGCIEKEKQVDYTNTKIGKLTVIKKLPKDGKNRKWLCECECGNKRILTTSEIKKEKYSSCGCVRKTNMKDLTNQRFGRLVVIKRTEQIGKSKQAYWECRCDCGNIITTNGYCLRSGMTKSCGCLLNEVRGKSSIKHGMAKTRLHNIWLGMKERCYIPSSNTYKDYGGRGIKICDEWLGENGFEHFKEWSLNNGYKDDLSIDRKNVNGNYEPSNCRWATYIQQANNKRNNVYITIDGEVHTLTEWCKILNVSRSTVTKRKGKGLPQELWFYKGRLKRKG